LQLDGKFVTAGFTPALDSAVGGVTPPPVSTRDMVLRATTRTAPSIRRSAKGGVVRIDFAGRDDRANGIAVKGDGAIGVAGTTEVAAGDFDVAIARLTPSGVLDTAFDTDGRVTIAFGRNQDEAADVEVQSDGRIVFSGYSGTLNASNSS
jgi:uncharacterized delta-60 repeat protein